MTTATQAPASTTDLPTAVANLQLARAEVKDIIVESDAFIDNLILSMISRTHGFVAGEGGVAKSFAIEQLTMRFEGSLFKTLFRKDMPREEIAGPVSMRGLEQDRYEHATTDYMPEANVVFADEFLDASTLILRSLLGIMNEREFKNGNKMMKVPLWSLFGASNFWPDDPSLAALADRFAWRMKAEPVKTSHGFKKVLRGQIDRTANGGVVPHTVTTISADEMALLHQAVANCAVPQDVLTTLDDLRKAAIQKGINVSVRRYGEGVKLAQANAVINGRSHVLEDDLALLRYVLPNDPEDFALATELTMGFAGKAAKEAMKFRKALEPLLAKLGPVHEAVIQNGNVDMAVITEVTTPLKRVKADIEKSIDGLKRDGRDPGELTKLHADIKAEQEFIRREVLG